MIWWKLNLNNPRRRAAEQESGQQAGFSLAEMLLVIAITSILSTILLMNFRTTASNKTARDQVSSVVVSDLRRAQSMALSGSQKDGTIVCGYGLHYIDSQTYSLYAKVPPGGVCSGLTGRNYASGDLIIEARKIANANFQIGAPFQDIFFQPPDPKTYINDSASLLPPVTTAINLVAVGQSCSSSNCTIITVSTSGSIDIAN